MLARVLGALFLVAPALAVWHTDATFVNKNTSVAADPYVRWDEGTKQYWAYSTEGANDGWYFGVYTSPDLATWSKQSGGALKNDQNASRLWADDWYWAPEVYYNSNTKWYFLFYAGRMTNPANAAAYFKYPDFEEASKIGVATSRSPAGPFVNIQASPLDYFPFDPNYADVNLIMQPPFLVPPKSLEEGQQAPKGTYIPHIDPNVFFDYSGSQLQGIYLFFSRNCYRNWVWDAKYGKYIEESNIYVVRLDDKWWNDAQAKTMPSVHKDFKDVNKGKAANWTQSINDTYAGPTRADGWVSIISRTLHPQIWEDAHVNDYSASGGTKKDRRWSEGSTTVKRTDSEGKSVFFLTYSSNNFENVNYGVGYAFSNSVLGPYVKSESNPILSQDPSRSIYSTGHGSIVAVKGKDSSDDLFYVHHARPSATDTRYLYVARLFINADQLYVAFGPNSGDIRFPSSVAPLKLSVEPSTGGNYAVHVTSADGASFDLSHPGNRVQAIVDGKEVAASSGGEVSLNGVGGGVVTFRYQRARYNQSEPWLGVKQFEGIGKALQYVEVNLTIGA